MTTTAAAGPRILVSTDSVKNGQQIVRLLEDDFAHVQLSMEPERVAADFEECRPDVLVLAFDKLENAQRYYLGLYRLGRFGPCASAPHRPALQQGRGPGRFRALQEGLLRRLRPPLAARPRWPSPFDERLDRLPRAVGEGAGRAAAVRAARPCTAPG
jgi:hypothetical protein